MPVRQSLLREFCDASLLDRFTVGLIALSALLVGYVTQRDLFWLIMASIAVGFWAWKVGDKELLRICCFGPLVYSFGFSAAKWLISFQHRRIDTLLAKIDMGVALGVQRWCEGHYALVLFLVAAYYAMGAEVLIALALTSRRREMLRTLLVASIAAVACYWVFPAVGPKWIDVPGAFPNGFPSMHFGFALICWLYATRYRWAFGVLALAIVGSTLGLGEHYAIDLVVAVPFILACDRIARVGAVSRPVDVTG